jgi:hypothetical protein
MKKPYNEQLEGALALERLLKKYVYVTEKIQNEVIHADTLMLYRRIEVELREQIDMLKKILDDMYGENNKTK